jgi:hypothetical protein
VIATIAAAIPAVNAPETVALVTIRTGDRLLTTGKHRRSAP